MSRAFPLAPPGSGVYQIRHIASNKVYVGSAKLFRQRWADHRFALKAGKHHSQKLQRSWDKYGPAAFAFEVLQFVEELSDLVECEQAWIDRLHAIGPLGFNIAPRAGSTLGVKRSEESLAKLRKPRPEEVKRKISLALTGRSRESPTAETRAKMSAALKLVVHGPLSEAHRAAISAGGRGEKATPETRAKMRAARLGKPGPRKPRSAATRAKMRKPKSPEHCANIAAAMTGKPKSATHVANMSAARKGVPDKPWSPERRAKPVKPWSPQTRASREAAKIARANARAKERIAA